MNWMNKAICRIDPHPERWVSFKIKDIEYAKTGCTKCTVKKECIMSYEENMIAGVIAGVSEYERLHLKWREAKDLNEFNW